MRECKICLEVVSMYYILTVLSGAKKHINDSPVSPLQSPTTCLLCAHDQTPLYTDTAGYVIAIWRLWVVIWCIWIAAHFLRVIQNAGFSASPISSVLLVFRPQLDVGHNLLSEKRVWIIRGICSVCCLQTSLTESDTSRASRIDRGRINKISIL